MNDKLNEVRRQIKDLRAEMSVLENQVRLQIRNDLDCSETSWRLLTARKEMVRLIWFRNQLGGREMALAYNERFAASLADLQKG